MEEVTAYIALGSNLGDRQAALSAAAQKISETPGIQVIKQSSVVETKPVGPIQDQPDFMNSVLEIKTSLSATALLEALLLIENKLGRVRTERWGPRTIDLDILLFGNQVINDPRLKIPHPEMANRSFIKSGLSELGRSI